MAQELLREPLELLTERINAGWDGRTKKGAIVCPDGECVFFYSEPGQYTRERVDDVLTVYRAPEGRLIGLQIKTSMLPRHHALVVEWTTKDGPEKDRRDLVKLLLFVFKHTTETADQEERLEDLFTEAIELVTAN